MSDKKEATHEEADPFLQHVGCGYTHPSLCRSATRVDRAGSSGFAELVDEPRWYKIPEEDAVDMLRKRMTNYGTKAKKLWMRQNAQAVITEYQKLVRQQEGR